MLSLSSLPSQWLAAAVERRDHAAPDIDAQHVRMFVLSHLLGPVIGLTLAGFLAGLGYPADYRLVGFAVLVCLFWVYPAALARGADYRRLSIASLQHLTFTALWASHGYGGLTSPFLLWLAVVPLLAFLYRAPDRRLWWVLIPMLAGSVILFAGSTLVFEPPSADPDRLRPLAAVSLVAALSYVGMMAVYFGRALESRDEMALQADQHGRLALDLDHRAEALRRDGLAKASSLARIARECSILVDEITSSSKTMLDMEARDQPGIECPDLRSIDEAAKHLGEVIRTIAARG